MASDRSIKPVILYDGVCNLCRSSVQFVIRHDANDRFLFASQQSEAGQELLSRYVRQEHRDLNTIILIDAGEVSYKSAAFLRILKRLDGLWPMLYPLVFLPRFLRDFGYDFIGQRRYKWFGKMDSCWVPDADLARRFLETKQDIENFRE